MRCLLASSEYVRDRRRRSGQAGVCGLPDWTRPQHSSVQEEAMSTPTKPSIVFCHGIWADGSCFNKLVPTLQAEGHEVMAAQYGLDSVKADVEATIRTFGRVSGPILLVGH